MAFLRRFSLTRVYVTACLLVAVASLTGCVPIAWVVPPLKIEAADGARLGIRANGPSDPSPARNDLRASAGVHLANLLRPEETHADVGVGYVLTEVGLGQRTVQGAYVEAGPVLARADGGNARLMLTLRGEALFPDRYLYGMGYAGFGRLSGELFGYQSPWYLEIPPNWSAGRGLFVGGGRGTYALDWFVEGGEQVLPGGERATVLGGGLSVRVAPSAGFGCCVVLPPKAWFPVRK